MPNIGYVAAINTARIAAPIFVAAAAFATMALVDYLFETEDDDNVEKFPILFFTDKDMSMHRRHIGNAQMGLGYNKFSYEGFRNTGILIPMCPPLSPVLTYSGIRRAVPLPEALDPANNPGDRALIVSALGNPNGDGTLTPRSYARDEYPFATTHEGGPDNWDLGLVSVDVVSQGESLRQAGLLSYFYSSSGVVPGNSPLSLFGVKASPLTNHNSGFIRRDGSKYYLP
jgi:hypothetical protein